MSAEDELLRVAERHFQDFYEAFPVAATTLGVHSHDNTLGSYDPDALAVRVANLSASQQRLGLIDTGKLPLSAQIDYGLVESHLELALSWYTQTKEWKRNPNFYAEIPVYGIFMLLAREFAPIEERAKSVTARLDEVPRLLATAQANVENPPKVFTEVAIQTTEGGIEFFKNAIPEFARQVPQVSRRMLQANQRALDAYADFLAFLNKDLLPRSHGSFAVGRAHFEERLRLEHALDTSAPELKRAGQRLFDDTERQLRELAAEIDSGRNWSEIIEEAKSQHPPADRLLESYVAEFQRLRSYVIAHDIVTVPENEELEATHTPLFARSTLPYAAYEPPAPFEKQQKGHFWVTPIEAGTPKDQQEVQLREHSYFALPAIALHEAYPGHHVQLVTSNNSSSFIRKHISSNIMCEGWALYCEEMIRRSGYRPAYLENFGDSERGLKLFHLFVLKDALWRAARVIIDVGLHTEGMSVEDAVRLLSDRVFLSEGAALAEVRRYTMSPTQPMSYAMGKHQITSLREEFRYLPLRKFHDLLLAEGTIPIKFIRHEMLAKMRKMR